jgi:hypothetical protein
VGDSRTEWKVLVRLPSAQQHRGLPIPTADDFASLCPTQKSASHTHIYHQDKVFHDCSISGFLPNSSLHVSHIAQFSQKRSIKGLLRSLLETFTPTQLAYKLRPYYLGWVDWGTLIAQSNVLIFTFGSMGVCIMRTLLNL